MHMGAVITGRSPYALRAAHHLAPWTVVLGHRVHGVRVPVRHAEIVALSAVNTVVVRLGKLFRLIEPATKLCGYIRLYNRFVQKMRQVHAGRRRTSQSRAPARWLQSRAL